MSEIRLGVSLATIVLSFFACSQEVKITPDPTGTSASNAASNGVTSTSAHSSGAMGSGTGGAGGAGNSAAVTTAVTVGVGGGNSCCGPVQVAGTVKTVTADNDPAQYFGSSGVANPSGQVSLGSGPFFFTGLLNQGNSNSILYTVSGVDCGQPPVTTLLTTIPLVMQGMRVFIPAGQTLCANYGVYYVTGFKPY